MNLFRKIAVLGLAAVLAFPFAAQAQRYGGVEGDVPTPMPAPRTPRRTTLPAPRRGMQTKRYFVISNKTGTKLTVFVRLNGQVWNWNFQPGQESRLCIDDVPILAEKLCFWAELPELRLVNNEYKDVALSLGPPYPANVPVAKFTFTFNRPPKQPPPKTRNVHGARVY